MGLWTPEHTKTLIPALVCMVLIAVLARLVLGKKEHKIRMIPFQILACVIFALEIGKQAVSLSRGYDLYHLPFHFCSLFIFSLPAMAFYRGKYQSAVSAITTAWTASLFLLMLIYPNLIYSAWDIKNYFKDYMCFHTVTFHNIVMLAFLLTISLDLHVPRKGDVKASMVATSVFCVISATMAQVLKTNYANYYSCNIPPLEEVRVSLQGVLGVVPTQILYVLIVSALNLMFVWLSYWLCRWVMHLLPKKQMQSV